jgi:hypothetical protein
MFMSQSSQLGESGKSESSFSDSFVALLSSIELMFSDTLLYSESIGIIGSILLSSEVTC